MRLAERLSKKGWTPEEIHHALYHMRVVQHTRKPLIKAAHASVYWLLLFANIVIVFTIADYLFPFLQLLPIPLGITLITLVGLITGLFFGFILHDVEDLTSTHHIVVMLLTTAIAVLHSIHSPMFGIVFSLAFHTQYLLRWWTK